MTSWTENLAPAPQLGDLLEAPRLREETLGYLWTRRSLTAAQMTGPGPTADERDALLAMAARVPDHRRVHPFRFLTIEGKARDQLGVVLAQAYKANDPAADEGTLKLEQGRFLRAPVVIVVVSCVDRTHKTLEWEQILTAGAVCQNLVIAAGAAGYAAQWLTEWYAYDPMVIKALGLTEGERVAGFVYIGTATEAPKERPRLAAKDLTSSWQGPQHQD
ncbi:MAG: nitroreductase family protein [Pseudomonadota bacterium]